MRKVLYSSLFEQYNGVHSLYVLQLMRRQDPRLIG